MKLTFGRRDLLQIFLHWEVVRHCDDLDVPVEIIEDSARDRSRRAGQLI